MRYNIRAYDESYRTIVSDCGDGHPGRVEAASNLVGLKWKGEGSYRVTYERRNLFDGETVRESDVREFSNPGELGLAVYGAILEHGLDVYVVKARK